MEEPVTGPSTPHPPGGSPPDHPTICLLLAHERNRQLLIGWLDSDYTVLTPDFDEISVSADVPGADLLVVDVGAYDRFAEQLRALRSDDGASFRPVVLLSPAGSPPTPPDRRALVDDVITIPVPKAELRARIHNLLSRRGLSLELAASEARFRSLFEGLPDPSLVLDENGRIERTNTAFCTLVGETLTACRDRPLADFSVFNQDAVQKIEAAVAASRRAEAVEAADPDDDERTVTYQTMNGEPRYAECKVSTVEMSADIEDVDSARYLVVLRDVTGRVQHKQELQRQVDRLNEFARMLAHELRNPLNIASGWLARARTSGTDDAFERVEGAHERMQEMIDDLLQLARRGKTIGETSRMSLEPLLTEVWESLPSDSATLRIAPELADVLIVGDRIRVREVFANLFGNAIAHGGEAVTVDVGLCDDQQGIYVADDGSGVTDATRDHLFEAGYTTAKEGHGLGLAIVEQVVNAHGWSISLVESDTGARFEITGIFVPSADVNPAESDS